MRPGSCTSSHRPHRIPQRRTPPRPNRTHSTPLPRRPLVILFPAIDLIDGVVRLERGDRNRMKVYSTTPLPSHANSRKRARAGSTSSTSPRRSAKTTAHAPREHARDSLDLFHRGAIDRRRRRRPLPRASTNSPRRVPSASPSAPSWSLNPGLPRSQRVDLESCSLRTSLPATGRSRSTAGAMALDATATR